MRSLSALQVYPMQVYVVVGLVALVVVLCVVTVLVVLRVYRRRRKDARYEAARRRSNKRKLATTPTRTPPKKNSVPGPVRATRRDKHERAERLKKKEKRKQVVSMWLPKRKGTLPTVKTSLVQPLPLKEEEVSYMFFLKIS